MIKDQTCAQLSELSEQEWQKVVVIIINRKIHAGAKYQILREFDAIMQELDIKYFVTGGSLLGIFRDADFIEWDDDVDADTLPDLISDKYQLLREKLIGSDFIVRYTDGDWPKYSIFKDGEKLSLGVLIPSKDGKWLLRPDYKYPSYLFKDGRLIDFKGLSLVLPNPPEAYLEHVYGKKWKIPLKSDDLTAYVNISVMRLSVKKWLAWKIKSYFRT